MSGPTANENLRLFPTETVAQENTAQLFTPTNAARLMGRHPSTVRRWIKAKRLRVTEEGLIPQHELVRLGYDVPRHPSPVPSASQAVEPGASQEAHLREIIRLLERELADAKAEKARLLAIIEAGQPRLPRHAQQPAHPPVWQRILEYIQNAPRPRRIWQVQRDLHLEASPSRELSRLVTRGLVVRLAPGLFTAPGRETAARAEEEERARTEEC